MPHTKSTKKRVKTNEVRRQRNMARASRMRHAIRDLRHHAQSGSSSQEELLLEYRKVSGLLDKMANKGYLHKNTAARLKSRLHPGAES